MSYSNIERQAIIKLLSDMMMVDGHSAQQEIQYLEYVKNLLGLHGISLDPTMDRNRALDIISDMSDDQKMEVAGMLQQMIMADGVQDKNEMYFWGEIVTYTGIDKVIERKTSGMNIPYDNAKIYLNASKISLRRRAPEYLSVIDEQARRFKSLFSDNIFTIEDKCDLIIEYTKQNVENSGWDLNDVDGVTWFIGNFTDAMVKSGVIDDYDAMFVKCFKKYFNL